MNRTSCEVIRLCLSQDLKYDVMNETVKKMWEILASKYLMKSAENRLHLKKETISFLIEEGGFN